MTTRTLAANAAALPIAPPANALGRRTMLASAGAAAVLAAIGTPAAAAPVVDPDALLWILRTRLQAARDAYAAESVRRSPEFVAALAELPSVPWSAMSVDADELRAAAIHARCEALDRLEAQWPVPTMTPEAEARQEAALDAETAAIFEIAATPTRTFAGLGFKVEVSTEESHLSPELVTSIMADVAAFAAAHPTLRT